MAAPKSQNDFNLSLWKKWKKYCHLEGKNQVKLNTEKKGPKPNWDVIIISIDLKR